MTTGRSREKVGTAQAVAPIQHFLDIVTATSLVAVFPIAAVWWLRASNILTSYLPGMALGVALSFGAAYAGRRFWQTRPGSEHVLFSELMVWGFVHRWYSDRRLASARAVLGTMSQAQRRLDDGLSPERQTKLLEQMASGLDSRDPKTFGHSRRVARYSWMIAMRMGLPREEVARIRTAAAVHDVGKIETPLGVLRKQGPLDDEEYAIMKRHPVDGARMVAVLNDDPLTAMVLHHHERLDGTGYPDRLSGEEIPLGARIISVADTFDAITAHRPYQAARPHKEALDILMKEAGKQLDPDVVRAFCRHYSGRRPLTFWTSLMTLPERAISQLGNGVGAVATAAKLAAAAALVGALAAGTATLSHPAVHQTPQQLELTSELAPSPAGALQNTSQAQGVNSGTRTRSAAHAVTRLTSGSATPLPGATPVAAPSTGAGGAGSQTLAAGGSATEATSPGGQGGGRSTERSEEGKGKGESGSGAGGSGASENSGSGQGGQGKGESPTLKGTVKGTVENTLEGTKGTVKEVGKTVGEVGKTVGGVGKTVGEVTTPVKETVGKTVEEVKGKVVEEVPAKVKEVKNKVGEVVGKLKL